MIDTKIIAMYLPQYHCIPENDMFWGKGFTDWTTVRKAKPLFAGHNQPRVPLYDNYYDLSVKENVKWQADLAKEYGIYGFGIYHYWFNNEKNLLTKPAEIIRDNDDVEINYFLAWDNGNWKRSWSNVSGNAWSPLADGENVQHQGSAILVPYILGGEEDWENHYNYLSTHFHKQKYIKVNNKPVFIIFNYSAEIYKMCEYWDKLAKNDGFNGMYFIFRNSGKKNIPEKELNGETLHVFNYEPQTSAWSKLSILQKIKWHYNQLFGKSQLPTKFVKYNYDRVWNNILNNASAEYSSDRYLHGCFVTYDDTPRRGRKGGRLITESSPEKFSFYLSQLLDISYKQNKEFIFLTAWNEWGEGAYLEPDSENKYTYLEAIKIAQK